MLRCLELAYELDHDAGPRLFGFSAFPCRDAKQTARMLNAHYTMETHV